MRKIQLVHAGKKPGQPEKIEPPDGVGEKLAHHEGPGRAAPQQLQIRDARAIRLVVRFDQSEFLRVQPFMPLRLAEEKQPERHPDKAKRTREYKCGSPAETLGQKRNHQRRHERADIRAAVEQARCERPLPPGEPVSDGLDRRRKIRRFADSEREPRHAELNGVTRQRVAHGRYAPHHHGQHIADPHAQPVDHSARQRHHQPVGQLKCGDDPAVIGFIPAEIFLEDRLQQPEHLAVDIVDGAGEEQQAANVPAQLRKIPSGLSPLL
jgi:hypothetical protein